MGTRRRSVEGVRSRGVPTGIRSAVQNHLLLATMAGLLLLAACDEPFEAVIVDSEGQKYRATCSDGEACLLEQVAGPVRAGRLVLHSPGRLVGVCSSAADVVALASCRPLVCQSERECPASHGMEHGPCIGGLCVEPSQDLVTADAVMLCLAGTGPPAGSKPLQVERYAMALNCGAPCRVPAPCRQP